MATFAVSMVKDEADVIAGMLRHLADEVDELIVADNGSTDGTRDILAALSRDLPLDVVDDPDPAYRQSEKMTALAERAAANGARWIVPVDADELWFSHLERISVVCANAERDVNVVPAVLFNHFATAIDPDDSDPFRSMQWRQRQPGALPKVAFRWEPGAVVHQGNHGVDLPSRAISVDLGFEVRHFPYRSPEQMVRKARNGAAAYRAADLPETLGAHWRSYDALIDRFGEQALHDVFRQYFWAFSPVDFGLVHDPAPYLRWRDDDVDPGPVPDG